MVLSKISGERPVIDGGFERSQRKTARVKKAQYIICRGKLSFIVLRSPPTRGSSQKAFNPKP